jgi:hypothetical protein
MCGLRDSLRRKPGLFHESGGLTLSDEVPDVEALNLGSPTFICTAGGVEGPLWPLWWQVLAAEAKEVPSIVVDVPSSEP